VEPPKAVAYQLTVPVDGVGVAVKATPPPPQRALPVPVTVGWDLTVAITSVRVAVVHPS
jgi:hypothetical protein